MDDPVPLNLPAAWAEREVFESNGTTYVLSCVQPGERWALHRDVELVGYIYAASAGWAFEWSELTEGITGTDWRDLVRLVVL